MASASKLFNSVASEKNFTQAGNRVTSRQPGRAFASTEALNYIPVGYNTSGGNMFRYGAFLTGLWGAGKKIKKKVNVLDSSGVDDALTSIETKLRTNTTDTPLRKELLYEKKQLTKRVSGMDKERLRQERIRKEVMDGDDASTSSSAANADNPATPDSKPTKSTKNKNFSNLQSKFSVLSENQKWALGAAGGVAALGAAGMAYSTISGSKNNPTGSAIMAAGTIGTIGLGIKGASHMMMNSARNGISKKAVSTARKTPAFIKNQKGRSIPDKVSAIKSRNKNVRTVLAHKTKQGKFANSLGAFAPSMGAIGGAAAMGGLAVGGLGIGRNTAGI